MFPQQQENTAWIKDTFSTRSVQICYKHDQLAGTWVQFGNLEEKERPSLKAAAK
jgi:hypothetical protein